MKLKNPEKWHVGAVYQFTTRRGKKSYVSLVEVFRVELIRHQSADWFLARVVYLSPPQLAGKKGSLGYYPLKPRWKYQGNKTDGTYPEELYPVLPE